ncbi:hypothetical protein V5O48_007848 [Marasmius crinis-equi]|uniref:Zn(2)-C6 fungal-type domain-containing protein n=1 Tax=Marasmius crinis-equi TaxID=585013 RepID=A0ABR3FFQ6_9AGAR
MPDWRLKLATLLKNHALFALSIGVVNALLSVASVLFQARKLAVGFAVGSAFCAVVVSIITFLQTRRRKAIRDVERPDVSTELRRIGPPRQPDTTPSESDPVISTGIERTTQPGLRARRSTPSASRHIPYDSAIRTNTPSHKISAKRRRPANFTRVSTAPLSIMEEIASTLSGAAVLIAIPEVALEIVQIAEGAVSNKSAFKRLAAQASALGCSVIDMCMQNENLWHSDTRVVDVSHLFRQIRDFTQVAAAREQSMLSEADREVLKDYLKKMGTLQRALQTGRHKDEASLDPSGPRPPTEMPGGPGDGGPDGGTPAGVTFNPMLPDMNAQMGAMGGADTGLAQQMMGAGGGPGPGTQGNDYVQKQAVTIETLMNRLTQADNPNHSPNAQFINGNSFASSSPMPSSAPTSDFRSSPTQTNGFDQTPLPPPSNFDDSHNQPTQPPQHQDYLSAINGHSQTNERPRPDGHFDDVLDEASEFKGEHKDNQKGKTGACQRCKTLKVRCEFKTDTGPCKRCLNGGHDCIIPGRKKRRTPPKREHLLAEIQKQAETIEKLMNQLAQAEEAKKNQVRSSASDAVSGSSSPPILSPSSGSYFEEPPSVMDAEKNKAVEDWIVKARESLAEFGGFIGIGGGSTISRLRNGTRTGE